MDRITRSTVRIEHKQAHRKNTTKTNKKPLTDHAQAMTALSQRERERGRERKRKRERKRERERGRGERKRKRERERE